MSTSRELILFIHGTGGAVPTDEGEAWWQRGSEFHQRMCDRFEGVADVQPAEHVFHWSGVNSETERVAAGAVLLKKLQALEAEGRRYHLIGNSHGGSVIWHALTASARNGQELYGLGSWVTVATPFMHIDPRPFDRWTLVPWVTTLVFGFLSFRFVDPYLKHVEEIWSVTGESVPLLLPLLWLVILVIGIGLLVKAVRRLWSRRRILADNEAAELAYSWYGDRWMAMWSSEDEVINGLVTSLSGTGEIIPRSRSNFRRLDSALWGLVAGPFRLVYNHVLAAAGDEFIWDRLRARLQGNDRPGAWVTGVSPCPLRSELCWPEVPASFQTEQKRLANRNGANFLERFRTSFGLIASEKQGVAGLVNHLRTRLTFSELVHTSYFEVENIDRILQAYIAPHLLDKTALPPSALAPDVAEWLQQGAQAPPVDLTPTVTTSGDGTGILRLSKAALIASFVGLAGVSVHVLSGAVVRQYTPQFQVDTMLQNTPIRRISLGERAEFWVDPRVFGWLSALVRNGQLDVALEQASWFKYAVADLAYSSILSALLRLGNEQRSAQLLADHPLLLDQTSRIADNLKRDGAVDALRILATELPLPVDTSPAYRPAHVLQVATNALAEVGRISAAIQLIVSADESLDKDASWAAVAFHVAATGDPYRASLLAEQIQDDSNKLVAYQSIVDSDQADSALLDTITLDVVNAFDQGYSCSADDSHVPVVDGVETWMQRFIDLERFDVATTLASACSDTGNLDAALVVPLIEAGLLDELRELIEQADDPAARRTLEGLAYTAFLQRAEFEQARELTGPFDWRAVTPVAIDALTHELMTTGDAENVTALLTELERARTQVTTDVDGLQFAIARFVALNVVEPEQQSVHAETLLAAARDFPWSTLDAFDKAPASEFVAEPMSDSDSESISRAIESLATIGHVSLAEQLADLRGTWPVTVNPYREIAAQYVALTDIPAADAAIAKAPQMSWADVDFAVLAEQLGDDNGLDRVETALNQVQVSGLDADRTWLSFARTLVSMDRVVRASGYVGRIEDEGLRDALLTRIIEDLLTHQNYDKVGPYLANISTDDGQERVLQMFQVLADGGAGHEVHGDDMQMPVDLITPDLGEAQKLVGLISSTRYRGKALTYLAGAVRRSGASTEESIKWLNMAENLLADEAELANADEVRSLIAEQQAELNRWNSAVAVCRDCNPIIITQTNARILNALWYYDTRRLRNERLDGTYIPELDYPTGQ